MENDRKKELFEKVRSVPEEVVNRFTRHNKEMATVNPMWRIEKLTELFGPCGTGWHITVTDRSVQEFRNGSVLLTLQVELAYKTDSRTWSKGVAGFGSAWLVRLDGAGVLVADDEAYKKAYTDATAIACKSLGFAADIYYTRNDDKYAADRRDAAREKPQAEEKPQEQKPEARRRSLTPETDVWKKFVVWAARRDWLDNRKVRMEIDRKWEVSDEDFERLMREAGRL